MRNIVILFVILIGINQGKAQNFVGTFTSNFGTLKLQQIGKSVFGDFDGTTSSAKGKYIFEGTYDRTKKRVNGKISPLKGTDQLGMVSLPMTLDYGIKGKVNVRLTQGGSVKVMLGTQTSKSAPQLMNYQTGFSGKITDSFSKTGVSKAKITFVAQGIGTTKTILTNTDGTYSILLPAAKYKVMIIKTGYKTYSLSKNQYISSRPNVRVIYNKLQVHDATLIRVNQPISKLEVTFGVQVIHHTDNTDESISYKDKLEFLGSIYGTIDNIRNSTTYFLEYGPGNFRTVPEDEKMHNIVTKTFDVTETAIKDGVLTIEVAISEVEPDHLTGDNILANIPFPKATFKIPLSDVKYGKTENYSKNLTFRESRQNATIKVIFSVKGL